MTPTKSDTDETRRQRKPTPTKTDANENQQQRKPTPTETDANRCQRKLGVHINMADSYM